MSSSSSPKSPSSPPTDTLLHDDPTDDPTGDAFAEATPPPAGAVAVVGMAGRFPGAADVEELWHNLRQGVESIRTFSAEEAAAAGVPEERLDDPRWVRAGGVLEEPGRFDAALFGISPREAEMTDPQHRLLLETAWAALEDAGHGAGATAPSGAPADVGRVGVYAGAGGPAYLLDHVHPRLGTSDDFATAYAVSLGNDKDFLATRLSYRLDLTGPSLAVGTACSTSLVAVCLAASALATGDCDLALAGGVTLRLPQERGYPYQEDGILSPDGHCRPFDEAARGTVPGSGVAMVVLKRLEDALADGDTVRAVIRGWATNNDGGGKAGYTAPRVEGQEEVIREAVALAGVDPSTVGYVEAHGTATPLGDPIEVEALRRAFAAEGGGRSGGEPTLLGSVKGNLGHLDAAAGVAGLIKAALAVERGVIPPSLHFERPNPRLGLEAETQDGEQGGEQSEEQAAAPRFAVAAEARQWRPTGHPRRAGVSSFGIGGTNAHVVLEAPPPVAHRPPARGPHLLALSAATEEGLAAVSRRLADHLEAHPDSDLADAAHTLRRGRRALEHRRAVVAADAREAVRKLRDEAELGQAGGAVAGQRPGVVFLFPGQGAQHPGMGAGLYAREPVFRRAIDRCVEILAPIYDRHPGLELAWALPPALPPEDEAGAELAARRLGHTALAQPAVFTVSWALAELWRSWGVVPEAMLGHSIGEYVAACRAGVFRLEDALAVVAERGLLMADLPRGSMLAVPLAAGELAARLAGGLSDVDPRLTVAADNAPGSSVASGPTRAVEELAHRLAADGVETRPLHTSHAFHSELVEAAVEPFRQRVAEVELAPPRVPFLSNVTGTWITAGEATDPAYWARHLRSAVAFRPAVEELLSAPERVFLEVGPGSSLTQLVRRQPAARGRLAVASALHPKELAMGGDAVEAETLLAAAGQLFTAGLPAPEAAFGERRRRRVPLPTYPFAGENHWIERAEGVEGVVGATGALAAPAADDSGVIAKEEDPADWFYLPSWRRLPPLGLAVAPGEDAEGLQRSVEKQLDKGERGGGERQLSEEAERGEEAEATGREAEVGERPSPVLLFAAGADGLAAELAAALERRERRVTVLGDGDELPASETGRRRLAVWLGAAGEAGDVRAERSGGATDDAARTASALLGLARRLGGDADLVAVSDGLYEVAGEAVSRPGRAAAAGIARVLVQETPGLGCRWVDLPAAATRSAADLDALAAEIVAPRPGNDAGEAGDGADDSAAEPLVALRGGRRWRQVFDRVPVATAPGGTSRSAPEGASATAPEGASATAPGGVSRTAPGAGRPAFAPGGRYLVLGGTGHFGVALAAHLLEELDARVMLADREALPEEAAEALAGLAADGGGELVVKSGDVTDRAFLGGLLAAAGERWGGLDGVVHAAGAPAGDYKPTGDVAEEDLAAHLGPKVAAAETLAEVLEEARGAGRHVPASDVPAGDLPTFVAATSSLTPVLGGVGLGLHAAADAAMDALLAQLAARTAATGEAAAAWVSIGWEVWDQPFSSALAGGADGGTPGEAAAGSLAQTLGLQQAALAMSADEVILSLRRALALAPEGRALVATGDLPARVRQWARGAGPRRAPAAGERDSDVPYRAPREPVEERVVGIWEEVLGVPKIGIDDDFFLLGGDSLAGLQVLSKMRSELDVELPLESFFEARTVAGMADVIAAERRRGEEEEERMAELLAEIESMPEDEVLAMLEEEG